MGDIIKLQEYDKGAYTGQYCRKRITYILEAYTGLEDGYCVLGCELIADSGREESHAGS